MEKKKVIVDGYEFLLDKEIYEKYRDSMGDTDEMAPLIVSSIIEKRTRSNTVQEALTKHTKEYLEDLVNQHLVYEMKGLGIL